MDEFECAAREGEEPDPEDVEDYSKHSMNVGVAARNIAERIPGMDPTKAYIIGLLPDIGRRMMLMNLF